MRKSMKSLLLAGLLTGCMLLEVFLIPSTETGVIFAAGESSVNAGVSSVFAEQLAIAKNNNQAGMEANNQVTTSLSITTVDENGAVSVCGYSNIGIAVVDTNLNVRKEPSESGKILGKLPKNGACEVLDIQDGWVKIKSGNVSGWVSGDYMLTGEEAIAKAEAEARLVATVTADLLYVREEPNTNCAKISSVAKGEELTIIEQGDGWIKIELDSETGWACADYVEIAYTLPKASTIAELRYGSGISDTRVSLVQYALQFVGGRYVWGGTSLTNGVDCSGFTMKIYQKYGVSLPHYSGSQSNCGTRIKASQAKPGDLFFYSNGSRINHVAIYIGNGQIVHASSPRAGIIISNAFYRTPTCVVNLLGD